MFRTQDTPALQRPAGGFYSAMFAATKAASIAKAALPVPVALAPQIATQRAAVSAAQVSRRRNVAIDSDDTDATHNEHLWQSWQDHDSLLADLKAV